MKRSRAFGWLGLVKMAKKDPDALEVLQDAIEERFARRLIEAESNAILSGIMERGEEWVVSFDGKRRVLTSYSMRFVRKYGVGPNSVVVWSTYHKKKPMARRLA